MAKQRAQRWETPTLADVVRRAVEICDPDDEDADLGEFEDAFEDEDEPVTGVADVETRIWEEVGRRIDPEPVNPAVTMAAATAVYLAFRRDEMGDDPDEILKLAARAEWKGHPPDNVRDWLEERGIDV
jgi:hypothetical protein